LYDLEKKIKLNINGLRPDRFRRSNLPHRFIFGDQIHEFRAQVHLLLRIRPAPAKEQAKAHVDVPKLMPIFIYFGS
jgi:hypothetical protein